MTDARPAPDLPPPERAPGDRSRTRFRNVFLHPLLFALFALPVLAAFALFGFLVPVWPVTLFGALVLFGLAGWAVGRGYRGLRGR